MRLRKWLRWLREGFGPPVKYTVRQQIFRGATFLLYLSFYSLMIWTLGYSDGTGTLPFISHIDTGFPEVVSEASAEDVQDFIENDDTDLTRYGEDINCVEYAWLLARQARWEGLEAWAIGLDFSEDSGHLILGFPTNTGEWIFVNPATDAIIHPRVGGEWEGRTIIEMRILRLVWMPFEAVGVTE